MAVSENTKPLPVVLCGKGESLGAVVIKHLAPEFEVIAFVLSPVTGSGLIPELLSGSTEPVLPPNAPQSSLGTANYSQRPVAILTGGGYSDEAVKEMMDAVMKASQTKENTLVDVPWLRPEKRYLTGGPPGPEAGPKIAERMKEAIRILEEESRLQSKPGQVVWY